MKIDEIKRYLTADKKDEFIKITNDIYQTTEHLNKNYPGYKEWFFDKQVKGCFTPKRNIIFIRNETDEIIGFSCLKKDDEECKICTLYVNPNYRMSGVGSLLLEESIKFLETTKPLITFTEDKLPMFAKIIEKYNWELTEIVDGIYNKGIKEFCFNGQLSKRDYRKELLEILRKLSKVANGKLEQNDSLDKLSIKNKKL